MSDKSVKVQFVTGPATPEGLAIADSLRHTLGMPKSDDVIVKLGGTHCTAKLLTADSGKSIAVSGQIAHDLCLPLPKTLWVKYDPADQTLHVGPVVAVFAVKRHKAGPRSRRLFGARNLDMRQLMRHGRSLGVLAYVVTPEGVDPKRRSLQGYVLSGKRWTTGRFPLPDVVYDRIQARSWERRPSAQGAKAYLQSKEDISYFNEGFFDKWSLHQKMVGHEALDRYLPVTRQLAGPTSLRSFLRDHPSTFIKPTEGSQGKGVVRVRRNRGAYEWRHGGRRQSTRRFDTLCQGVGRIQRRRRYIMQPDLQLATIGGCPFDVRILMQKDGTGDWKRTKIYARVAAKGRLTSNLSRGGTGMGLGGVLRARFGRARGRVRGRINNAARAIVQALDEVLEGPLGEVGLDLGLDRRGRVWLIEVNAKPFRKVFDAGPKRGVRLSFRRPMAFARYLAGF